MTQLSERTYQRLLQQLDSSDSVSIVPNLTRFGCKLVFLAYGIVDSNCRRGTIFL